MSRGPYTEAQAKILGLLQERADAEGIVSDLSHDRMARLTGVGSGSVSPAINALIDAGKLTRTVEGTGRQKAVYQLGGTGRQPEASGIEATTWHLPNRNYLGFEGTLPVVEISLPRLRFLETTEIK